MILARLRCWLLGHDVLLKYATERMYLACHSCTWSSPGWDVPTDRKLRFRLRVQRKRPALHIVKRSA